MPTPVAASIAVPPPPPLLPSCCRRIRSCRRRLHCHAASVAVLPQPSLPSSCLCRHHCHAVPCCCRHLRLCIPGEFLGISQEFPFWLLKKGNSSSSQEGNQYNTMYRPGGMRQKLVPFLKGMSFCLVRPPRRSVPLPPAAGGVCKDNDEDWADVVARGRSDVGVDARIVVSPPHPPS